VWAQNLVAFLGLNARADQVEEHATGSTAPAAIGEHETAGALGLQRLVEDRLHPCGSKDTHGALQLFAGAGLGLPQLGGDLVGGDLVAGGGRVFCGWYSLSRVHTTMLAGPNLGPGRMVPRPEPLCSFTTHPRTHAPTHPRTHAPTHPRTHAPTHPRTHVLACDLMGEPCEPPNQSPTTRPRTHDDAGVDAYTLDVTAAATLLGRSENTVRRLIRAGELPADQVNGTRAVEYRLREADVRDALGRLGTKASSRSWARGRLDAYMHDGRVGTSSVGEAPAPTSAAAAGVAGVQALIEQATAPLVEANRRLQDANERLTDQLMRQAEELGRLREHQKDAEAVRTTQPAEGHMDTPSSRAPRSDDPGALWAALAAHVRPPPAAPPEPTPVPTLRRSLL